MTTFLDEIARTVGCLPACLLVLFLSFSFPLRARRWLKVCESRAQLIRRSGWLNYNTSGRARAHKQQNVVVWRREKKGTGRERERGGKLLIVLVRRALK